MSRGRRPVRGMDLSRDYLNVIAAAARWQSSRAARAAVILLGCVPLAAGYDAANDGLGANPVEAVLHRTGDWALRLLLATLAVSPLRRWTGWSWLLHLRRPLGLLAFGYAMLHALTYVVLDRGLVWEDIVADVLERPYVTAGSTALVLWRPSPPPRRALRCGVSARAGSSCTGWSTPSPCLRCCIFSGREARRPEPVVYAGVLAVLLLVRLPAVLRGRRRGRTGAREALRPSRPDRRPRRGARRRRTGCTARASRGWCRRRPARETTPRRAGRPGRGRRPRG